MRGIVRKHPVSVIVGVLLLALVLAPLLPEILPEKDRAEWRVSPSPRRAEARLPEERLVIIGDEVLYITSKTTPRQLASSVSPQAVNVWLWVEGEDMRAKFYGQATSTSGGILGNEREVWLEYEEIGPSNYVLDEDSALTGTSVYAVYYGRP